MSKPLYLGKLHLYWCRSCNLPILSEKCNCSSDTDKLEVTPPGDVRPAFKHDIDFINSISIKQFNTPLVSTRKIVLLNKIPSEDRMEEIIVDGEIIGSIRYEIEDLKWKLLLRLSGARRLFQYNKQDKSNIKSWVIIDDSAVKPIANGANALSPGIIDADYGIVKEDEVVVLTPENKVVATGRAKMTGNEMVESSRGKAVKTRWRDFPVSDKLSTLYDSTVQTWNDVLDVNMHIMDNYIEHAHSFIKNVSASYNLPLSVSYSGGKDSLTVLQLVSECLNDFTIIFADTGLEFPETVENTYMVADKYNQDLKTESAGNAFWESVDNFGPPSIEVRWCCKVCKLGPITRLIENNFENGCLTFIGQRKYESSNRAKSKNVWKNPWVNNQIAASPIQNWTALHVWLYLFKTNAPYNPLYEKGFDRIGCWLCPSASLADFKRLKDTHPKMEKQLKDYLLDYANRMGLSKDWVKYGLWRWKKLPPNIEKMAERKGIDTVPKSNMENQNKSTFSMTSGYSPCKSGGIVAEGSFGTTIDMELIKDTGLLLPVGSVSYMDGAASIFSNKDSVHVFASGNITSRGGSQKKTKKLMKKAEFSVRRALKCSGCGVCVAHCPNNAIQIESDTAVVGDKCTHCSECIRVCPVVKYKDLTV
ncbi:phosphoadenosine phosphosulfate reductase family protein [Methanohalobium sp.]|uniref:phosphoadenosine phosphosulfate reductase domain-containing protein n=1 Tax=Methanohalobium sp. TaxID=2837493 RepID=UPI0025E7DAE5|nr:phosphoadenosine phosphosulfate reductase family protein [Methanohalobium sp.]